MEDMSWLISSKRKLFVVRYLVLDVNTFDEILRCSAVIIRSNFEIHFESFSDEHFEEESLAAS